jgi:Na+-translocating ferredoxin:NAD+ oxidoreductase subunit G
MKNFAKLLIVLFIICGAAAGSLSLVNQVTAAPIAAFELEEKAKAMKELLPAAAEFKALWQDINSKNEVWEALKESVTIGYVVKTSIQGYGGPIDLMAGFDDEQRITGVKILAQTETAGLGTRITDPVFLKQFAGLTQDELVLKKSGGDLAKNLAGTLYTFPKAEAGRAAGVDAITGATVSSRAMLSGLNKACIILQGGDATTGASANAVTTEEKKQ